MYVFHDWPRAERHNVRLLASVAALAFGGLLAGSAFAQTPPPAAAPAPEPDWTFTGNVGLFSQYVFRGISQTNEKPAIQGGLDLGHKSGFYVGTWASNISWLSDTNPDVSAPIEWDFYGGYKWSLPSDFVADFGAIYYWYPGTYPAGYSPKPNTTELYAALNWRMLQVKYSYAVTDTFGFPNSDGSYYIEGNVNWDVVEMVNDYIGKVTLIGHVGYQSYKSNGDLLVHGLEGRRRHRSARRDAGTRRHRHRCHEFAVQQSLRQGHQRNASRRLRPEDVLMMCRFTFSTVVQRRHEWVRCACARMGDHARRLR